jgi:hypothetical protein
MGRSDKKVEGESAANAHPKGQGQWGAVLVVLCASIALIGILGCRQREDLSGIEPTVRQKGALAWHCDFGGRTTVEVKAYLSVASKDVEEVFESKRALQAEILERARRMELEAPTEALRKSYREEIELYEKDLFAFTGSWEGWPIVMVIPILQEDPEPTKAVVICRDANRGVDIAFTMYCPDEIAHAALLKVARRLTSELKALNSEKWDSFRISTEPVLGEQGQATHEELADFAEGAVFIEQR